MSPKIAVVHQYDMDRTVVDGELTKCGKDLRDVKWTAGYTAAGRRVKVTCKVCLKAAPIRKERL